MARQAQALCCHPPRFLVLAPHAAGIQPAGSTPASTLDKEGLTNGWRRTVGTRTASRPLPVVVTCGPARKQGNAYNDPSQPPPVPGPSIFQRFNQSPAPLPGAAVAPSLSVCCQPAPAPLRLFAPNPFESGTQPLHLPLSPELPPCFDESHVASGQVQSVFPLMSLCPETPVPILSGLKRGATKVCCTRQWGPGIFKGRDHILPPCPPALVLHAIRK